MYSFEFKYNPDFRNFCLDYISNNRGNANVELFNDVIVLSLSNKDVWSKYNLKVKDVQGIVGNLYIKLLNDFENTPNSNSLNNLNLCKSTINTLKRAYIFTIPQLLERINSENGLNNIRNLGDKRKSEIYKSLNLPFNNSVELSYTRYIIFNKSLNKYLNQRNNSWGSFEDATLFSNFCTANDIASSSSDLLLKTCKITLE